MTLITGDERRRRWSEEDRVRILGAIEEPDAVVAEVARREDVCTSLVYKWILVDQHLETSAPGIFAARDVANFLDIVFKERCRIEHWDNAVKQGRLAARNMLGRRLAYDEVSYFFCNILDLSFNFLGSTREIDERISRGSLEDRSFTLFYLKNNVLSASFSMGRPANETLATELLIRHRINLRSVKDRLSDPDFAGRHPESDRSDPAGRRGAGRLRMRGGQSAGGGKHPSRYHRRGFHWTLQRRDHRGESRQSRGCAGTLATAAAIVPGDGPHRG
jgi:hypothetical protein